MILPFLFVAMALAQPGPDVGKDWGVQRSMYQDPVTGIEIAELTGPELRASNLYYHFSNFTADNRYVILAAARHGSTQIYRSEVATGRLVQLTDEAGVAAASCTPHPREARLLYFTRGADVVELDIHSFRQRKVGAAPGPAAGGYGQPTLSHDLRSITLTRQLDPANWEIGLMDVASGGYRTVVRQGFRIGHVQHSPLRADIFYVWETGGYAPQRSWIVGADGSANRPFYFRTDPKTWLTPLKEWLTHESWIPETGQMTMILDKTGILLVEPDGSNRLLVHGNYWHCAARRDGAYVVADDFEGRIWLIESRTGNTRLIATGTRKDRTVHAHPSFDREGRYVLFNSTRAHATVAIARPH